LRAVVRIVFGSALTDLGSPRAGLTDGCERVFATSMPMRDDLDEQDADSGALAPAVDSRGSPRNGVMQFDGALALEA